jgi:pimeloyl-ACP methyl ester carboxylesterase
MSSIDAGTETVTEIRESITATHQTAETRFVDGGRRALRIPPLWSPGPPPLLMLQHFRGNLDAWDPALTDALARECEVILVDYPGVSSSSGAFGPTIADRPAT